MRKYCILLLFIQANCFSNWHERKAEGWAWYEDRKEKKEEKIISERDYALILEEEQKKLQAKLAEALLNPTEENVLEYMQEQKKKMEKISQFVSMWKKVLLNHPELDHTVKFPVTEYGLQAKHHFDLQEKKKLFSRLANEKGLVFFYEGGESFSQIFAQTISDFQKKWNWPVMAISMDGKHINMLDSKNNNGIAETFSCTVFPSLYLFNPRTREAFPVAHGLLSIEQIETNIINIQEELSNAS